MNAKEIIAEVVEQEMMKHVLWFSSKRCSCGLWNLPHKEKQYGTIPLQHAKHVADVIAMRLSNPMTYRETHAAA